MDNIISNVFKKVAVIFLVLGMLFSPISSSLNIPKNDFIGVQKAHAADPCGTTAGQKE